MAIKLSGPRAFRPVVMTVVVVVVASFFAAIIIATWSGGRCGRSSAELLRTWLAWSMVDMVGAQRSCSGRGRRGRSSTELLGTWSELDGAAWDVVDVVGAWWSCSGHGLVVGGLCRHKTRRRQVSSGSQRRPPRSAGRAEDKSSILVMTLTESRELGLSSSSASCAHVEICAHPGSL